MIASPSDPHATTRRSLLFGGLLAAAGLAAPVGRAALSSAAPEPPTLPSLVPDPFSRWRSVPSQDLVVPADVPQRVFYDRELQRTYVADGAPPIMLVMAYCSRPQQGLIRIHDPRLCYPGAGFELQPTGEAPLAVGESTAIDVESFAAVRPDRMEQVVYWTRVGDIITSPDDDQHLMILRTVLAGGIPDGLLVRISAIGEGPAVMNEIRRFALELVAAMSPRGREFLLGPSLASSWSGMASAQSR